MSIRTRTRTGLAAPLLAMALASGCGGQTHYANDPRPPQLIQVSAAIVEGRIHVSPNKVGAGPLELLVANLSHKSHDVSIEPVGGGGAQAKTGPINPQGTASVKLSVEPGSYRVTASSSDVTPDVLSVGPKRKSAQNQLLQP